jgi:hypothetical protein
MREYDAWSFAFHSPCNSDEMIILGLDLEGACTFFVLAMAGTA